MEIKYITEASQGMRAQVNVAREVLEAKRTREQQQVPLSARQVKRLRARQAAREQKKATRRYQRKLFAANREEQNLLGLARVYFAYVDVSPAVFNNVERHLESVEEGIFQHLWDKGSNPEPINELYTEASARMQSRLNEVLDKAHTEAVATAENMTYADTRGRTFVSVVKD